MANYDGLTRNAWPGTWSTNGTHPIVLDVEMRGGLRLVSGLDDDILVNIPSGMLQDGMLAYVASGYHADITDNTYYKYSILSGESRDSNTGFLPNASGNWSEFSTGGSSSRRIYNNITSDFSMSSNSDVVFLDTTSGPINVELPTAVGQGGKEILIKLKTGSNSGVLIGSGTETIDGNAVFPIYHQGQSFSVISDDSNWYVF
jgi:hypothetical protein